MSIPEPVTGLTETEREALALFTIAQGDVEAYGRTDALAAVVDRILAARVADAEARVRAEVSGSGRPSNERDGVCICDYNPSTTDGPQEDCPFHGRPYAYWVERGDELQRRLAEVEGKVRTLHGSTHWCFDSDGGDVVFESGTEWWPCPTLAALSSPEAECHCPPCPGRGNDGHGLTHCAECCYGTGVEADIDCPIHGAPEADAPVPSGTRRWT